MKPKPFSGLNHFTVPVATAIPSFLGPERTWVLFAGPPARWPAKGTARSELRAEPSPSVYGAASGARSCLAHPRLVHRAELRRVVLRQDRRARDLRADPARRIARH